MFRHTGKRRTLRHNLQIASWLSFVAGMVNVTGFLAVQRLTTNVTGHFAFFTEEVFRLDGGRALVYFAYIACFFTGSCFAAFLVEWIARKNEHYVYVVPAGIEALLLLSTGMAGRPLAPVHPDLVACSLLFSMGLQNALVTGISGARVRTTHLTGLFTDLGMECAQLFFYRQPEQKARLTASIRLRCTIVAFFFTGGIAGGLLHTRLGLRTLVAAALVLAAGLLYDYLKYKLLTLKRRWMTPGT
jgi:uncharacterized membrane protein YoaK (UPF0700 family)